jgi:DNA-binding transcriptional LysR family regulator
MDLNDVATFVRIAEDASVTAAARALGVPKSTVSRSLARLELALGVRLVHRTTRALALTEAGRAYFDRVRGPVAGVAEATADVVDLGAEPRGAIRITAPPDVGELLLAGVVARFTEKYPDVSFEVTLTSRIVDMVAEGFDLAVRAAPLRDSSLVARKLLSADLGLFASPGYLKRRGTPRAVAELAEHEVVGFRAAQMRTPLTLTGPGGVVQVAVKGPVDADDLLFVRGLLVAGGGIGMLPLFFAGCAADVEKQGLKRVLPEWAVRGGSLSVMAPSARHEPRRVRVFREFLVDEVKRLQG